MDGAVCLGTVFEKKYLVLIDAHLVACAHPSINKRFTSGLTAPLVPQHRRVSADKKLALLVWTRKGPVGTDNVGFNTEDENSGRARLVLGASIKHARDGLHGDGHCEFGHAVTFSNSWYVCEMGENLVSELGLEVRGAACDCLHRLHISSFGAWMVNDLV
jgi:hypothetical protein